MGTLFLAYFSFEENGKEILSINEVLKYLLRSSQPLVSDTDLAVIEKLNKEEWQSWVEVICGMIITYPGKVSMATSHTFNLL